MSRTAFLSSMNASSEPLNMKVVWADPDTAPYSVYQHITYLREEPHQDGKCMVFPRSTDCVMSFNCIRKPHFVASHKSHDFVGFRLDRAQPACCSSLSWAHVVEYQPANDSASGVGWTPGKSGGGGWVGWLSSSTRCAMQSDPRRSEAEPRWTSTLESLLASCLLTSH